VVSLTDLQFTPAETTALAGVLEAYRRGNLLAALDRFGASPPPDSPNVRTLRAALVLSVGRVNEAQAQLDSLAVATPAERALRTLMAAVKLRRLDTPPAPATASEALALSYYLQAQGGSSSLAEAREAARKATALNPEFGFAWVRLAELEFSFGRAQASRLALERGLALSPEHAQGFALRGFVLSAANRVRDAAAVFERAIALDPALANAWLGRGLCRLRLGAVDAGRADLEIAAALEPNRSVLRSYLGKAFSEIRHEDLAARELKLAQELDRNDPTPWLYAALLSRQLNQINAAVAELERSVTLNENRRLYRSRLLLDQDRAVRSASLANIYQGAGLNDVSVREASQAVNADYANPSAHLFLSESYNALRDPKRIQLRYETTWFNERLLANLLAPVGGGNLSQHITEQEYSRFFARDRAGLSLASEYSSVGDSRTLASQFGTWRNTAWALDVEYHHFDGYVPNSGFERVEWYSQIKQQITPADSLLFLTKYQDFTAGDTLQYFEPAGARPGFEFSEQQRPILLAGYQHEWQPGVQTLALFGRLDNELTYTNPGQGTLYLERTTNQVQNTTFLRPFYDASYRNQTENYTAELSQIFEGEHHQLVLGGRLNRGHFKTRNLINNVAAYQPGIADIFVAPADDDLTTDIERESAYGYYTWKTGTFLATAGVAYDRIRYPENFRYLPVSSGQTRAAQISPKAAIVWTPVPELRLRGIWARGLGGVTYDESIRLEPTQLAGFVQSFRTLISETVVGSVAVPELEVWGAGAEWTPWAGTYLGAEFDWRRETVDRRIGVFNFQPSTNSFGVEVAGGLTPEKLDYEEPSVSAYANQLLGERWAVGAAYRFTRSELDLWKPDLSATPSFAAQHQQADYHELSLQLRWQDRTGWFWRLEGLWRRQDYATSQPVMTREDFWQFNGFAGYRLRRLRGELTLGVLNLFDQDYRLQPLSPYLDLPRERAFYVAARFNF
jgi:hypothetical protein